MSKVIFLYQSEGDIKEKYIRHERRKTSENIREKLSRLVVRLEVRSENESVASMWMQVCVWGVFSSDLP